MVDHQLQSLARDCCKRIAPKAACGSSQIVAPGRDLSNPDVCFDSIKAIEAAREVHTLKCLTRFYSSSPNSFDFVFMYFVFKWVTIRGFSIAST